MLLIILLKKKLLERSTKTNSKKQIRKSLIENVTKRKGDKLYVKWKGYNKPFNSWINKKDIV